MISTLLLSLLIGSTAAPAGVTAETLAPSCLAAIEGKINAGRTCLDAVKTEADEMRVDLNDSDFQSSCLVIPAYRYRDLIDIYIEWLLDHPDSMGKQATITINAALLEEVPCGWRMR